VGSLKQAKNKKVMELFITIVLMMWILFWLFPPLLARLKRKLRGLTGKRTANIFEHHYLESKAFYMYCFRAIPCTTYIDDIDLSKAFPTGSRALNNPKIAKPETSNSNCHEFSCNRSKTFFIEFLF
jgi:hypothetical protein